MRNELIRLAIMNHGNYWALRKAVESGAQGDPGIRIPKAITILDEDYPARLLELQYPPYVLFYTGNKELLKKPAAAVVGSRKVCEYGARATEDIVRQIADAYVIVSGMAKGIDAIAHWNGKESIGVLGNGLNIDYPIENRELYEYMRNKQLLISEYPLNERPRAYYFPFRNRIIAALADKIIVTQAASRSGTLITVNAALDLNRNVYVLPYPYGSVYGAGCNELIQQGANVIRKSAVDELLR